MINPEIINLRKELHRNPELSSFEYGTAKRIRRFIEKHNPTDILENIGGTGLVAIYKYQKKGKSVCRQIKVDFFRYKLSEC